MKKAEAFVWPTNTTSAADLISFSRENDFMNNLLRRLGLYLIKVANAINDTKDTKGSQESGLPCVEGQKFRLR